MRDWRGLWAYRCGGYVPILCVDLGLRLRCNTATCGQFARLALALALALARVPWQARRWLVLGENTIWRAG